MFDEVVEYTIFSKKKEFINIVAKIKEENKIYIIIESLCIVN